MLSNRVSVLIVDVSFFEIFMSSPMLLEEVRSLLKRIYFGTADHVVLTNNLPTEEILKRLISVHALLLRFPWV